MLNNAFLLSGVCLSYDYLGSRWKYSFWSLLYSIRYKLYVI